MSYHGLGALSLDPTVIGNQVAKIVVPPVVSAVKAELPSFLASVQPVLTQQGTQLLSSLQPQLEKQAKSAAASLQPMIDNQVGVLEKRLNALIDTKVSDIASGAEIKHLKQQAAIALAVHAAVVLMGTALLLKISRKSLWHAMQGTRRSVTNSCCKMLTVTIASRPRPSCRRWSPRSITR